ncbi:hypothetical protein GCM10010372_46790 [Streptomyces tauricus]|uniref:Secreted protein n=1 Tax=Streptomyces tauricus TaxID=68274 RepID=A0ABZ1JKF1_9ACTN|nr:hypothetical protein [Streptomyces tauricus]MCW8098501.1 hypothetical protein [Streptomyces tauricus]GHA41276.1 hypothetical protein GCM10010372_46790 [Streptomyces tauricus]
MPRPTAAQLAYGSCTVLLSTLAMLLLSQTSSGLGVVIIALSALVLGLLVAMTVPVPKPTTIATAAPSRAGAASEQRVPDQRVAQPRISARRETVSAASASEPIRERA